MVKRKIERQTHIRIFISDIPKLKKYMIRRKITSQAQAIRKLLR